MKTLANVTASDLGTPNSRRGPIPLITIRIKAGEDIRHPSPEFVSGNYIIHVRSGLEPDFVKTFERNLSQMCFADLDVVSLAALSLVI